MAKHYAAHNNSVIIIQMNKNRLQKSDICRLLNISIPTINNWIANPGLIRFYDLHLLASIFNMGVLELVYLLDRGKAKIKRDDKWFLQEIKNKYQKE